MAHIENNRPQNRIKFCLLMLLWWGVSLWVFLHFDIARTP